jgi:hypothetical protein
MVVTQQPSLGGIDRARNVQNSDCSAFETWLRERTGVGESVANLVGG